MLSKLRNGRITSSQIYRIAKNYKNGKFLKPALTYIEEVKMEIKLKRGIDGGGSSNAIKWGNYMETRLFNKLGFDWTFSAENTLLHPSEKLSKYWAGTPDLMAEEMIGEIKCFQLKHFCQIVDVFEDFNKGNKTKEETIEILKSKEPEIYWQALSNAIICEVKKCQLIIYAPNEVEMDEIRHDVENSETLENPYQYRFIVECDDSELAVIPKESEYQSINIFEFDVPMDDKIHLTKSMMEAIKIIEKE